MAYLYDVAMTPSMVLHDLMNAKETFTMFDAYAQILDNVANCHFESTYTDIVDVCDETDACTFPKMFENFSKHHMDLIIMADNVPEEMRKEVRSVFPAKEAVDFAK